VNRFRSLARVTGPLAALALATSVLAGCSADSGGGGSTGVKVTDAWARTSPMVAAAGAAYMVIENTGSEVDALLGASSPAAATVEVHETYEVEAESPMASDGMAPESPMASDGMGGGMMGMRPIARLEIPAGGSVELKPGGYHVMLIDLTADLTVGSTIEITLRFEQAGEVKVTAEVREG
jgi:periplasmic copper chaperone A